MFWFITFPLLARCLDMKYLNFSSNTNPTSRQVNMTISSSVTDASYGVELWFRPFSPTPSGSFPIFSIRNDWTAHYLKDENSVQVLSKSSSQLCKLPSVPSNYWTHLAFTFDITGRVFRCFKNATLTDQMNSAETVSNSPDLISIGGKFVGSYFELRVWTGNIPSEYEIRRNFKNYFVKPFHSSLKRYYRMVNEGDDSIFKEYVSSTTVSVSNFYFKGLWVSEDPGSLLICKPGDYNLNYDCEKCPESCSFCGGRRSSSCFATSRSFINLKKISDKTNLRFTFPDGILTIEFWLYPFSWSTDLEVFSVGGLIKVKQRGTDEIISFYDGKDNEIFNFPAIPKRWVHIAWVSQKNNRADIYINFSSTNVTWSNRTIDSKFYIGSNSTARFNGYVADLRMWTTRRTSNDIKGYMFSNFTTVPSQMPVYCPLNDTSSKINCRGSNLALSSLSSVVEKQDCTSSNCNFWCPVGMFFDEDFGECRDCDGSCLSCNGIFADNCTVCPSGSYFVSGTSNCYKACSAEYMAEGYLILDLLCVSECPILYNLNNTWCISQSSSQLEYNFYNKNSTITDSFKLITFQAPLETPAILAYARGWFISTISESNPFVLSPFSTLSLWIRLNQTGSILTKMNSSITELNISVISQYELYVSLLLLEQPDNIALSSVKTTEYFISSDTSLLNEWLMLSFGSIKTKEITTLNFYLFSSVIQSYSVDYAHRQSYSNTFFTIGDRSKKMFIYSFHYFSQTNSQNLISLIGNCYDCNCPSSLGICNWNCNIDELILEGSAVKCLSECQSCRYEDSCNLCSDPICSICNSMTEQSCISCSDNAYLDDINCKCNNDYRQVGSFCKTCNLRCEGCVEVLNCANCFQGFIQSSEGICQPTCAFGDYFEGTKCIANPQITFHFIFNKVTNIFKSGNFTLYLGNNDSFWPNYDSQDPWLMYQRGLYFKSSIAKIGNSSEYQDIKVGTTNSFGIFLYAADSRTSYVFYLQSSTSEINMVLAIVVTNKVNILIDYLVYTLLYPNELPLYIPFTLKTWNYLGWTLSYKDNTLTLSAFLNGQASLSSTYNLGAYNQSIQTGLAIGGLSGANFKGFIYELYLYSGILDRFAINSNCDTSKCKMCSSYGDCLVDCDIYSFFNGTHCESCLGECKNGCSNKFGCNLFPDQLCSKYEYLNQSCQVCVEFTTENKYPCQCVDNTYYSFDNCSCISTLNDVCYNICPTFYKKENSNCVLEDSHVLKFIFSTPNFSVSSNNSFSNISMKTYSTIYNKNLSISFDPIYSDNRGFYFRRVSNSINMTSSEQILMSHMHSIGFWINFESAGEFFSKSNLSLSLNNLTQFELIKDFNQKFASSQFKVTLNIWMLIGYACDYFKPDTIVSFFVDDFLYERVTIYSNYLKDDASYFYIGKVSQSKFVGWIYEFLYSAENMNIESIYYEVMICNSCICPVDLLKCLNTCFSWEFILDSLCVLVCPILYDTNDASCIPQSSSQIELNFHQNALNVTDSLGLITFRAPNETPAIPAYARGWFISTLYESETFVLSPFSTLSLWIRLNDTGSILTKMKSSITELNISLTSQNELYVGLLLLEESEDRSNRNLKTIEFFSSSDNYLLNKWLMLSFGSIQIKEIMTLNLYLFNSVLQSYSLDHTHRISYRDTYFTVGDKSKKMFIYSFSYFSFTNFQNLFSLIGNCSDCYCPSSLGFCNWNCNVDEMIMDGLTVKCLSECQSCRYNNSCTVCRDSRLRKNNCTTCVGNRNCLVCIEDFYLENYICVECTENCTLCDSSKACEGCKSGFYLSEGECTPCINNCTICSSAESCSNCLPGFYLDNNTCTQCVENCTLCISQSNCSECSSGYYLNYEACPACTNNCTKCISKTECLACLPGFYLSGTTCEICINNCSLCFEVNNCSACNVGSYLKGIICETCDKRCIKCSGVDQCSECVQGYYLNGISCYPCPVECKACISGDNCTKCVDGYGLNKGACLARYVLESDIIEKKIASGFKSINFKFMYDIQSTTSTNCSSFFYSGISTFGNDPSCSASGKTLKVFFGAGYTISMITIITFSEELLLLKIGNAEVPASVTVDYSTDPYVKAIINGLSKASYHCSGGDSTPLIYDGSSSTASYQISSYEWLITNSTYDVILTATTNSIILNATNADIYSIKLHVTDILGNMDIEIFTLELVNQDTLKFTLDTGSGNVFKRSSRIKITPVFTDICGCTSPVSYVWIVDNQVPDTLDFTRSSLRIKEKTLDVGTYTFTLIPTCSNSVTGSASVTIIVIATLPIATTDKADQQVPDNKNLVIRASSSYDPDGNNLTYSWTSSGISKSRRLELSGTSETLTITPPELELYDSLIVILTVTTSDLRAASKSHLFTIEHAAKLSLSVFGPDRKRAVSNDITLKSRASYTTTENSNLPIFYKWNKAGLPIFGETLSYYTIKGGTLASGTSYTFGVEAYNMAGDSILGTVIFATNAGAACEGVELAPIKSSYSADDQVEFKAVNCVDLDNEDYPLIYKYSIEKSGKYSLISVLATNTLTSRKYKIAITGIRADVCDTLSDCVTLQKDLPRSSKTGLFKESSTIDDYVSDKLKFDLFYAISMALIEKLTDESTLDLMWNDLIEYELDEFNTEDSFEQLTSIILEFIDTPQLESLAVPRLEKYFSFYKSKLSLIESINANTLNLINYMAERLSNIDISEQTSILALTLLTTIGKFNQEFGSLFTQTTSLIQVSQLVELQAGLTPRVVGSNEVILRDSGLRENSIIRFVAGSFSLLNSYSDIIQVEVTSSKYFVENTEEKYDTVLEMNAPIRGCIVLMAYSGLNENEVCCSYYDNEKWANKYCDVLKASKNIASISIIKSGIYKVVKKESSKIESKICLNLYIMISLIIFCALAMPFMIYIDKKVHYMDIPTEPSTNKSVLEGKFGSEHAKVSIFSKHLLISIFISTNDMQRSDKLITIISNIMLGILIQTAFLQEFSIHPAFVGIISTGVVLTICLIILSLLKLKVIRKISNFFRILLGIFVMSASIVGVYLLKTHNLWYLAFIVGLVSEIVVGETIIMGVRHVFNF